VKLSDAIKRITPITVRAIIETNPQPSAYCEQQISHLARPINQHNRPQEEIDQLITAYTVLRTAILSREIGEHNLLQLIAYIDGFNHMAKDCRHKEGTYTGLYYFDEYGTQWYMVESTNGEFETTDKPKSEPFDLTNVAYFAYDPNLPVCDQIEMMLA